MEILLRISVRPFASQNGTCGGCRTKKYSSNIFRRSGCYARLGYGACRPLASCTLAYGAERLRPNGLMLLWKSNQKIFGRGLRPWWPSAITLIESEVKILWTFSALAKIIAKSETAFHFLRIFLKKINKTKTQHRFHARRRTKLYQLIRRIEFLIPLVNSFHQKFLHMKNFFGKKFCKFIFAPDENLVFDARKLASHYFDIKFFGPRSSQARRSQAKKFFGCMLNSIFQNS